MEARIELVLKVQKAIQKAFGEKYTVSMFGSAYYGMDSATSDLDLVVFVSARATVALHLTQRDLQDPEHKRGWIGGKEKRPLPGMLKYTRHKPGLSTTY